MEDATRVELAQNQATQPPPESEENRVLSFAELKELIESGNVDKIPNNKIIPEAINVSNLAYHLLSQHLTVR